MSGPTPVLHATLIARRFPDGWRGALLRGPSGAGKSDLALRALDAGFRLVADDRVLAWASGGRLWGRAPATITGLVETRHVGVLSLSPLPMARIRLVVDLCEDAPERLPDPRWETIAGVETPRLALRPFEDGTPARIAAALQAGFGPV